MGGQYAAVGFAGLVRELRAAAADLALGSLCAGCGERPGLLCAPCRSSFVGPAVVGELPEAAGVAADGLTLATVGDYEGGLRTAILDHKEHGRLGLARPLGDALAVAVTAALEAGGGCPACGSRAVALVPAPSRRRATRHRGHDPLVRMARRAAVVLRRAGQPAIAVPALRHARAVADQAGLSRRARAANLRGAVRVRAGAVGLLRGRCVVVVDDVTTTGATLREAVRSLAAAEVEACSAAALAQVV